MKRFFAIVLVLFALVVFSTELSPELRKRIESSSPNDTVRIQLFFQRPDYESIKGLTRQGIIDYLKNFSQKTQKRFLKKKYGKNLRSYWIVNRVFVTVKVSEIENISQEKDIVYIDVNHVYRIEEPKEEYTISREGNVEWNIEKIKAPEVWKMGYTGKGVVIGFIDTGIDATHPAIKEQRYQDGPSWFDATTDTGADPYDDIGHGTHVTGTALGKNGIGVAPDAKWIMVRALGKNKC